MHFLNFFPPFVSESEQQEDEEPKGSTENGDGSSANQPSSSLINKPSVVGKDVNSEQVTEEKQKEKESDDKTKKEDPPTVPDQTGAETTAINCFFFVFLVQKESHFEKDFMKIMSKHVSKDNSE